MLLGGYISSENMLPISGYDSEFSLRYVCCTRCEKDNVSRALLTLQNVPT